jgi:selenocysteine-specific elongation factor
VCSAKGEAALFHKRFPQLLGPNLQRLRLALGPRLAPEPAAAAMALMVADGTLAHEGGVYRLPEHRLGLDRADDGLWRRIAPLLGGAARFRPPRTGEIATTLGAREFDCRRVLKAKAQQGAASEIAPDHFFLRETLAEIAGHIAELGADGEFAAAELRDRLDNGRKVAIQLLEWFDRQGVTIRRGDLRTVDPGRLARYREAEPA